MSLLHQNLSGGLEFILTIRSKELRHHAGQISLPGGRADTADSCLEHTALRECEEEIGLDMNSVEVLGQLDTVFTPSGFCVRLFVAYIESLPELRADPQEVDEIFHIPLNFILDQDVYQIGKANINGIKREFYFFDYKEYYVWGATAGILRSLSQELNLILKAS